MPTFMSNLLHGYCLPSLNIFSQPYDCKSSSNKYKIGGEEGHTFLGFFSFYNLEDIYSHIFAIPLLKLSDYSQISYQFLNSSLLLEDY